MGLINWILGLGKKSKSSKIEELKNETRTILNESPINIELSADESNKSLASYLEFLTNHGKLYRGKVVDRFIRAYKSEYVNVDKIDNLIFKMTPEILELHSAFIRYKISSKDDELNKLLIP